MKNAEDNCQKWESKKVDPRTITITANIAVADFNNGDIRIDGGNTKNKQSKSAEDIQNHKNEHDSLFGINLFDIFSKKVFHGKLFSEFGDDVVYLLNKHNIADDTNNAGDNHHPAD